MTARSQVISVFSDAGAFVRALERVKEMGLRDLVVYSPVGMPAIEHLLPRRGSPIRFVVLAAAATGCALGFWMCIGSALLYGLIVGGKWPASWLPYCVIGFEATILFGGLTAIAAIIAFARLRPARTTPAYDPRFGEDRFGLYVRCPQHQTASVMSALREAGAEEIDER